MLKVKTNVGTCKGMEYPLSFYDECRVIGDIYENVDLLESDKTHEQYERNCFKELKENANLQ